MNPPSSVSVHRPKRLEDLWEAFERLDRGESVALQAAHNNGVDSGELEPPGPQDSWLGVYSSGSTGRPKLIWRPWQEVRAEVRTQASSSGWTWASSYAPETFAGVQVALQAWRTGGALLSLGTDWSKSWRELVEQKADALSCTPTFLDLLLQFEEQALWFPRQITLGGEVLRSTSGARFAKRFPSTRFSVIYASAELGVLLKTHRLDGCYELASFSKRSFEWRVRDDVLEIRKAGPWTSTGDRVEIQGTLLRVVGRADGVANVGGAKVCLDEIGRLAEEVPGVRRAVAFVEPSPVVGQIVALKYSIEPGADQGLVQSNLETHLRKHSRKEAWPRRWELDLVGLGQNSKRTRR